MGKNNQWIIDILEKALASWNDKITEIWSLITQSPAEFRGGAIWDVMVTIHNSLQAIGFALLVLFFVMGIVKTCGNFNEIKRPEQALKLFIRFILAKTVVTYGMDLMLAIFKIIQGISSRIISSAGFINPGQTVLPQEIITAIQNTGFLNSVGLWAISLIGSLCITVLSFVMILTVYGRFFKMYLYTALAPIPLSSFAGETTSNVGRSFVKSYIAVCLEGAVIVLGCIIFSLFASNPPVLDTSLSASTLAFTYVGEIIFNMLVLVGTVKMSDRVVREMMGL